MPQGSLKFFTFHLVYIKTLEILSYGKGWVLGRGSRLGQAKLTCMKENLLAHSHLVSCISFRVLKTSSRTCTGCCVRGSCKCL